MNGRSGPKKNLLKRQKGKNFVLGKFKIARERELKYEK